MNDLVTFLNEFANHIVAYLTGLAGLSVVTMALIQAAKTLLPVRRDFNEKALIKWLLSSVKSAWERRPNSAADPAEIVARAEAELRRLSANGDRDAFYNAEVSDFIDQLNATVQLLVDYPSVRPELFLIISHAATVADQQIVLRSDETLRKDYKRLSEVAGDVDEREPERREALDARHRVRAMVTRSVEALRLSTAATWKRRLQAAAFVISIILAIIAFWLGGNLTQHFFLMVISAVMAAFLAPVARDILAAFEKVRT